MTAASAQRAAAGAVDVRRRLIFALDVERMETAERLIDELAAEVGLFKVGKQLFVRAGPEIVRRIQARGGGVFLDLKFHDIPGTVALAGVEAARLGVRMFDVHASGGVEMMRAVVEELARTCSREGLAVPQVLAVTVLTSLTRDDLRRLGIASGVPRQVARLARLAAESGLAGVVASPHEVGAIRRVCGRDFVVVTPGVRPAASGWDDQKRVMTPQAAIRAGADYLVVGRPIRDAPRPADAARAIVADMAQAFATRARG